MHPRRTLEIHETTRFSPVWDGLDDRDERPYFELLNTTSRWGVRLCSNHTGCQWPCTIHCPVRSGLVGFDHRTETSEKDLEVASDMVGWDYLVKTFTEVAGHPAVHKRQTQDEWCLNWKDADKPVANERGAAPTEGSGLDKNYSSNGTNVGELDEGAELPGHPLACEDAGASPRERRGRKELLHTES
ncbi:hypothetical protein BDN71DRAFT_1493995 [Pleurotus eryngii]|uniref:Uncharacterized protein n=1 Tax=Pleurotus eryngii TaxID=5323 RepID=A0A9P6D9Q6_PLEER|nr:hypothetical protein BDN71DRAFT_1493995 [Pleurotus eryngii]